MCAVPATARIETPIGMIELVAVGDALTSVRIFPETGNEWAHRQNSALECAVEIIENAGHKTMIDQPEKVYEAVSRFFNKVENNK